MKLSQKSIKKIRNWKTWVALFALVGMILEAFGITNFEGTLGKIQEIVYTAGIILGVWSDHEGGKVQ